MGRKRAGVNRFAQKGLYEKMSFGSSEGLEEGLFEGAGTESPLHDPAGKVNGDYRERRPSDLVEGRATNMSLPLQLPPAES